MLTLHFLGVGDGDCIVLELPDGRVGLVDSNLRPGRDHSPALDFVREREIAFCCLTHPHADHYQGMLELLQAAKYDRRASEDSVFWYGLSDLDKILDHLLNPVTPGDDNTVSGPDRRRGSHGLADLLGWILDTRPLGFSERILNVTRKVLGDVTLTLVGPSPRAFDHYVRYLARQRARNLPASSDYANKISLAILVSYGETNVWLMGDLCGLPLRRLTARVRKSGLVSEQGLRASVIKVPHHGAANGWFEGIGTQLTHCRSTDIVLFSANGFDHPDPDVWHRWNSTGKQLWPTWDTARSCEPPGFGGWAADILNTVSDNSDVYAPRDIRVEVRRDGQVTCRYA